MSARSILVGIGSPHGDDQVGWLVARQLAMAAPERFELHCLRAPLELLDLLESHAAIARLEICDAVVGPLPSGRLLAWTWPDPDIGAARFTGSHDLSLAAALELADSLGRLPREVRVWGVTIASYDPFASVTPWLAAVVPRLVDEMLGAGHHA